MSNISFSDAIALQKANPHLSLNQLLTSNKSKLTHKEKAKLRKLIKWIIFISLCLSSTKVY